MSTEENEEITSENLTIDDEEQVPSSELVDDEESSQLNDEI